MYPSQITIGDIALHNELSSLQNKQKSKRNSSTDNNTTERVVSVSRSN